MPDAVRGPAARTAAVAEVTAPSPTRRFPRSARLLSGPQFKRVFAEGRRLAHPLIQLHAAPSDDGPRLGLAVSRRCDRRAVVRNRIKRVLRDRFRHALPGLPSMDLVAVARAGAATASTAELAEAFEGLLRRAARLKPPGPGGTMPAAADPPAPIPASE